MDNGREVGAEGAEIEQLEHYITMHSPIHVICETLFSLIPKFLQVCLHLADKKQPKIFQSLQCNISN